MDVIQTRPDPVKTLEWRLAADNAQPTLTSILNKEHHEDRLSP